MHSPSYDYSLNIYYEDGRLAIGLLSGLIYLLVASALWVLLSESEIAALESTLAFADVHVLGILASVTLGASLLGLLMAFSRFDGFFAVSYGLLAGSGWILFLMVWLVTDAEIAVIVERGIPNVQARAYAILIELVNGAQLHNDAAQENRGYAALFGVSAILWLLSFFGTWSIFRNGHTWRAVAVTASLLLICISFAGRASMTILLLFTLLALALLVQTHLSECQRSWRRRQITFEPDIGSKIWRNGLVYTMGVLVVIGSASIWSTSTLESDLSLRRLVGSLTQPHGIANAWQLEGGRALGNTPILEVAVEKGRQARYLRGFTYDTYTGSGWTNHSDLNRGFAADEFVSGGGWAMRNSLTQRITVRGETGGVIYAAPDLVKSNYPFQAAYSPITAAALINTTPTDTGQPAQTIDLASASATGGLGPGDSYTVVSQVTQVAPQLLRNAGTAYPSAEFVTRYTQLPDSFSNRVRQTAIKETVGATTVYDKAIRLEAYLRGFTYDETISSPPAGSDPVEYFLYDIQRGYCDYYATAMVTMLRSLGIPARPARGYAEGELVAQEGVGMVSSELDEDVQDAYLFTAQDAHAWVEVYFPQYGWIEFEPTAGESSLERSVTSELIPLVTPKATQTSQTPAPEETPQTPSAEGPAPSKEALIKLWESVASQWLIAAILAIVIGLIGVVWLFLGNPVQFALARFRVERAAPQPELAPRLFVHMHRWAARIGIPAQPAATPYEQANRLSAKVPQGRNAIAHITDAYVRHQFSSASVNAVWQEEQGALNALVKHWKGLRSIFVKVWATQQFGRLLHKQGDLYSFTGRK